jgi:hypothetical protein
MVWATDSLISPGTWKKHAIWGELISSSERTRPELSQFQVIYQDGGITPLGWWPTGSIVGACIVNVSARMRRAELEACDQGAVQGQWIRVSQVATLPKPES